MPSMNILTELQSVIQSINNINTAVNDFKRRALEIAVSFNEANHEPYSNAIDKLTNSYSHKEMFIYLAILAEDKSMDKLLKNADVQPWELFEKSIVEPLIGDKKKIINLIKLAMLKGYIEDKEIVKYWKDKQLHVNVNAIRYNIKKLLYLYQAQSRSELMRCFIRDFS